MKPKRLHKPKQATPLEGGRWEASEGKAPREKMFERCRNSSMHHVLASADFERRFLRSAIQFAANNAAHAGGRQSSVGLALRQRHLRNLIGN